jgi:hypothetical protein
VEKKIADALPPAAPLQRMKRVGQKIILDIANTSELQETDNQSITEPRYYYNLRSKNSTIDVDGFPSIFSLFMSIDFLPLFTSYTLKICN